MKTLLLIAAAVSPFAALAGLATYDRSETSDRYTIDSTWSGDSAIFHHSDGRLFADSKPENIGYFGGGRPRLVAFNCAGRAPDAILIAMEESDLPRCKRIVPIDGAPALAWSR